MEDSTIESSMDMTKQVLKEAAVVLWLQENPAGSYEECTKALDKMDIGREVFDEVVSLTARSREALSEARPQAVTKHAGGRPKSNKTVRMTITMTPDTQRRLRLLCAGDNCTASDWIEKTVAAAFADFEL